VVRLTAKTDAGGSADGKVSGNQFGQCGRRQSPEKQVRAEADDEIPGDRAGQSLGGKIPGDRAGRDPAVLLRETGPIGLAGGKTDSRCSHRSGCV